MDYGKTLTRAWEITWRWKVLWVLGFLSGLAGGSGGGGGGGNNNLRQGSTGTTNPFNFNIPPAWIGVLVAVACLAMIVGLALWVVGTMARGGLIAGVAQVEDQGSTSFTSAWRVGQHRFWTLFGIEVLVALPVIVLLLVGVLGALVAMGGMAALSNGSGFKAANLGILLACGIPLLCVTVLLVLVLDLIRTYAERAAILEQRTWIDAFRRGWQVLRDHLGPTLVFWLIFLVIGLVIGAVVIGGIVALIVPFAAFSGFDHFQPWMLLPLCGGGLIGLVLASVLGAIVQTFTSATWTLAYRQLTAQTGGIAAGPSLVEGAAGQDPTSA